jgi:hypothetical protein
MPLSEQAEYADYVTRKMCEPDEAYLWNDYAAEVVDGLERLPSISGSCAIGNTAHVILHMADGPLNARALAAFARLLEPLKNQ